MTFFTYYSVEDGSPKTDIARLDNHSEKRSFYHLCNGCSLLSRVVLGTHRVEIGPLSEYNRTTSRGMGKRVMGEMSVKNTSISVERTIKNARHPTEAECHCLIETILSSCAKIRSVSLRAKYIQVNVLF